MGKEFRDGLKYSENHSWVKVERDTAILGITAHAADSVKEFVFIDLPQKGPIKKGDTYVSLESIKWSGHLSSPVSGEIVEVNESLFDDPLKLNDDPYGNWICKVRISDPAELDSLMDAKQAEEHFSK